MNLSHDQEIEVGSIVYFIAAKTQSVIPGLVCEKIVRTSIDGSSKVNYVLEIRAKEGTKRVEVDPVKAELFPSPQKVEEHLISSAVSHIKQIVQRAVENTQLWEKERKPPRVSQDEVSSVLDATDTQEEGTLVDLGDGTTARLKITGKL